MPSAGVSESVVYDLRSCRLRGRYSSVSRLTGYDWARRNVRHSFLDRRYRRDPDFVFRRIVDEVILLPIRKNLGDLESIFTVNEVGGRVWELLDGRRTVEEIRDRIVDEFEAIPETVSADLDEFLGRLEEIGAIAAVE